MTRTEGQEVAKSGLRESLPLRLTKHGPERSQDVPGRFVARAPVLGANVASQPGHSRPPEAKPGRVLGSGLRGGEFVRGSGRVRQFGSR